VPICAAARMATAVVLARRSAPERVRPAEPTTPVAERGSACCSAGAGGLPRLLLLLRPYRHLCHGRRWVSDWVSAPRPTNPVPTVQPRGTPRFKRLHPGSRFRANHLVDPFSNLCTELRRDGGDRKDRGRHCRPGLPVEVQEVLVSGGPVLQLLNCSDPIDVAYSRNVLLNL